MQLTVVPHVATAVAVHVKVDAKAPAEMHVVAVRMVAEALVAMDVQALVVVALVHLNSFYVMDLIMEV